MMYLERSTERDFNNDKDTKYEHETKRDKKLHARDLHL